MKKISLDIKNRNGENLSAHLITPINGVINNIAIFAHCFTCSSSLAVVKNISNELTNQGISVLNFDFTGLVIVREILVKLHFLIIFQI